jgi:hypothetical protein
MATSKVQYGSLTNITCTLASLASGSSRSCAFIDNSVDRFLDAMVVLNIQLATGTPSGNQAVRVWFYGSVDGTTYLDNALGTDAAITLRTRSNLRGPWVISTPDSGGLTYNMIIPSVGVFFGGNLPVRWGFVVENSTGVTFNATEGNHKKQYRGLYLVTE